MAVLQVFIHRGCMSEQPAYVLADQIRKEFPGCRVDVIDNQERARTLGLPAVPALVLDGELLAVGVPSKDWLVSRLHERSMRPKR